MTKKNRSVIQSRGKLLSPENQALARKHSPAVPALSGNGTLLQDVRELILKGRGAVVRTTNTTLIATYWHIGERIQRDILKDERGEYGRRVIEGLAKSLSQEFGEGFNRTNLFDMVRFASTFEDLEIVRTLCGQLAWSHFRILIYQDKPFQREFYASMCAIQHWSVRELRRQIQGMLYERVALSKKPEEIVDHALKSLVEKGQMSPDMVFLDHVNLSALGLKDNLSSEQDLENAILREIEIVLRELGCNFAFIKRQYRFRVDKSTYSIDLLFYNRRLRALVAVELKLGKFEPAYMGQMELYLRWLEKHEMLPGESPPYGLILCAEASREHIELLRLDEHGIHVAEYFTEFPSPKQFQIQLHAAIERARERLAVREPIEPESKRDNAA